uniref:NADH dehydrogenase subunit 6 n=1 Tax=Sycophila sp. 2 JXW-2020 TaxID=2781670 RepID=A0A8A3UXZ1_9HYME|nr:NADH dehydrogenase subunit 6 [Sycophila sp. 2 JXW-2020]
MMKIMMMLFSSMMLMTLSMLSMNFNYKKSHPLMLISSLILTLLISSVSMSIFFNDHWFSFIMFIIMVGGMMIIFLYFISFINNLKTSMKWILLKNIPMKMILMMLFFFSFINLMKINSWNMNMMETYKMNIIDFKDLNNYNLMYLKPKNLLTIMSMLYLLMSMTIIVKICISKKLMLRKFN